MSDKSSKREPLVVAGAQFLGATCPCFCPAN